MSEIPRIRSAARRILDGDSRGARMTLILALIVTLVAAVGIYTVSLGLYSLGYLLFGEAAWLDVAANGIMILLGIAVGLPLVASLFRMACLAAVVPAAKTAAPALPEILYPFTSVRAYGRCMAVGLETLGWCALWLGIPAVTYSKLAAVFAHMAIRGYHTTLCNLLTVAAFLVCLAIGALMLFLSGRRMGYGYFVFSREDKSLREINRAFRKRPRGLVKPLLLRLSLLGWIAVSILGVLIPFVVHTIPYALCLSAAYGQEMDVLE